MAAGIQALQSSLGRIAKKLRLKENKISVVVQNSDGTVDFPENCNSGVLLVPPPMTEEEWEQQQEFEKSKDVDR